MSQVTCAFPALGAKNVHIILNGCWSVIAITSKNKPIAWRGHRIAFEFLSAVQLP